MRLLPDEQEKEWLKVWEYVRKALGPRRRATDPSDLFSLTDTFSGSRGMVKPQLIFPETVNPSQDHAIEAHNNHIYAKESNSL
jgi:hypothetical protein